MSIIKYDKYTIYLNLIVLSFSIVLYVICEESFICD